jgi:hypothetical protein
MATCDEDEELFLSSELPVADCEYDQEAASTDRGLPQQSPQFRMPETLLLDEMRCVSCDAPVPNATCGRREPCPSCGFPYPLGDCSDYAVN